MEVQIYETESPRLRYRRLRANDYAAVAPILRDEQTMYAWGHAFSYDEVCDWIADMLRRYRQDGCGYFAAIDKQSGQLAALAGPLIEHLADGEPVMGIGYIVRRDLWRQGYGTECAEAALTYAFDNLNAGRVAALIRPSNLSSLYVAANCGFRPVGKVVKSYNGQNLMHVVCMVDQAGYEQHRLSRMIDRKEKKQAAPPAEPELPAEPESPEALPAG